VYDYLFIACVPNGVIDPRRQIYHDSQYCLKSRVALKYVDLVHQYCMASKYVGILKGQKLRYDYSKLRHSKVSRRIFRRVELSFPQLSIISLG
jgi:hypothetical protein